MKVEKEERSGRKREIERPATIGCVFIEGMEGRERGDTEGEHDGVCKIRERRTGLERTSASPIIQGNQLSWTSNRMGS